MSTTETLIKKIKTSVPDKIGHEAFDYYMSVVNSFESSDVVPVSFHTSVHDPDLVGDMAAAFIGGFAKIQKSQDEFIYSNQPLSIVSFDTSDFIEIDEGDYQKIAVFVVLIWTNGLVCYGEGPSPNGVLKDLSVVVCDQTFTDWLDGQEKQTQETAQK